MAKERDVTAEGGKPWYQPAIRKHWKTGEEAIEGADLMNLMFPGGRKGTPGGYGEVKSPPRPGTREPQMSEDQIVDMLRRKLGSDFNAAMGIPVHQWGGEWKKSSKDMKARIRAVQEVYQDMQRMQMTTAQAEPQEALEFTYSEPGEAIGPMQMSTGPVTGPVNPFEMEYRQALAQERLAKWESDEERARW
jgi:hypothetical protein